MFRSCNRLGRCATELFIESLNECPTRCSVCRHLQALNVRVTLHYEIWKHWQCACQSTEDSVKVPSSLMPRPAPTSPRLADVALMNTEIPGHLQRFHACIPAQLQMTCFDLFPVGISLPPIATANRKSVAHQSNKTLLAAEA